MCLYVDLNSQYPAKNHEIEYLHYNSGDGHRCGFSISFRSEQSLAPGDGVMHCILGRSRFRVKVCNNNQGFPIRHTVWLFVTTLFCFYLDRL
mgnify:CR=1 FL=1